MTRFCCSRGGAKDFYGLNLTILAVDLGLNVVVRDTMTELFRRIPKPKKGKIAPLAFTAIQILLVMVIMLALGLTIGGVFLAPVLFISDMSAVDGRVLIIISNPSFLNVQIPPGLNITLMEFHGDKMLGTHIIDHPVLVRGRSITSCWFPSLNAPPTLCDKLVYLRLQRLSWRNFMTKTTFPSQSLHPFMFPCPTL